MAIPELGMLTKVRGQQGRIVAIRPLGVVDVELANGSFVRVAGLYQPGWPTETLLAQ